MPDAPAHLQCIPVREADALGKIVDGPVVLPQPFAGETATLVGVDIVRLQVEGFVEIVKGLLELVLVIAAFAPPAVGIAILGAEPQQVGIIVNRLFVVLLL